MRLLAPVAAVAAVVAVVVVGAWAGVCAVAVHTRTPTLLLAVVATGAVSHALPPGWLRGGFAAGWLVVLGAAVLGRPEGDWAVIADWRGYTLLVAGLVLLSHAAGTVPRRGARAT